MDSRQVSMKDHGDWYGRPQEHIRSIAVDIILTIITFYIFNIWVQYKQMLAVNAMVKEQRYTFWKWALLSIITCGLYHIYHEFRKSSDIALALGEPQSPEPLVNVILTIFALGLVADAIQQARINRYFGDESL